MFQIIIEHLPEQHEMDVVRSTTSVQDHTFEHVVTGPDLVRFQKLVRKVPISEAVLRYAVNLVRATRPAERVGASLLPNGAPDFIKEWVSYGASVRAAQYLVLGGKARAIMKGRLHVSFEDIRAMAHSVMRHRILLNFHAESERVTTGNVVDRLLEAVPVPRSGM